MEVLTMKKTYTVVATKTGKEWKSFNDGMDMLYDNKKYRMEKKEALPLRQGLFFFLTMRFLVL